MHTPGLFDKLFHLEAVEEILGLIHIFAVVDAFHYEVDNTFFTQKIGILARNLDSVS